jgi:hypothetical protein
MVVNKLFQMVNSADPKVSRGSLSGGVSELISVVAGATFCRNSLHSLEFPNLRPHNAATKRVALR